MLLQISIFLAILGIFVSGINTNTTFLSILISFVAVFLGLLSLIKSKVRIILPKNFIIMIIFTLILHVYLLFVKNNTNPFYFAAIMSEGLIYWLIFYNLEKGSEIFIKILSILTIFYSFLYLTSIIFDFSFISLAKRFFEIGGKNRHWNIGNLSAITLVALVGLQVGKIKAKTTIIIILNLILLTVSNVRSAFLSLAVGLGYIFYKRDYLSRINKYASFVIFTLIAILFMVSSLGKTTIFDRPYYFQSIASIVNHPLGVGMGNFNQIATEYLERGTDGTLLASSTFNIFFETLSGVGVFSVIFLVFLIYTLKDIFKKNVSSVVWGAVTLTILTNFMLDASYMIPGMMWILFISLGVFQSKESKSISSF